MLAAARALAEFGTPPPGAEDGSVYRQRSGGVLLPKGADWVAASQELRRAYRQHPEVDRAIAG
ncbi:MAG: hypothetical protein ACRDHX_05080 [Chloroflexota bacterium]